MTPIEFDPAQRVVATVETLLDAAARRADGRYYVGMPDLNAPGEIVALLRDTQRFLFDFMDDPAPIKPAIDEATEAWWRYWQAANGVVHQWIDGYLYWMGIWSDSPSADLQCDFNVMISPQMFDDYFLPGLEQQTRWVERTIFHLDGPEAIRHLDSLLSLPRLDGIQWVPGDGKPPMSQWMPPAAPHPGTRTPGRRPVRAVGGGDIGQRVGAGGVAVADELRFGGGSAGSVEAGAGVDGAEAVGCAVRKRNGISMQAKESGGIVEVNSHWHHEIARL